MAKPLFLRKRYKPPKQVSPRASSLPRDSESYLRFSRAYRSFIGLAVGDSLGERFFGPIVKVIANIEQREIPQAPWRYTDDTEMAISILDVLDRSGELDQDLLAHCFASRFNERRGYGSGAWGLLRNLRMGFSWQEEAPAMFHGTGSFGNGGAMRVAPLGAFFADDVERAAQQARLSAQVTHAHLEGQLGAVATAAATALVWQRSQAEEKATPAELFEGVLDQLPPSDVRTGIEEAATIAPDTEITKVVQALGSGGAVSAQDTVPFCLWCAFHNLDSYEEAFWRTVSGLGDRDTTCAIVGGIIASQENVKPPVEWVEACEALIWDDLKDL